MNTHMLKMHGINLKQETDEQDATGETVEGAESSKQANSRLLQTHSQSARSGGVVCDICNKELCSKYFLKVHKQNTHGIATETYLCSQTPFLCSPLMMAGASPASLCANIDSKLEGSAHSSSHAESAYRLAQFGQQGATNPLALLCLGALGPGALSPFSPLAVSPGMIVDGILRNQHLFSRGQPQSALQPQSQLQPQPQSQSQSSRRGSKGAKLDPASSTHYTEACPMCERRFKSIKWLKTHMMNDHKQEIGAYMQMMMQYLTAAALKGVV